MPVKLPSVNDVILIEIFKQNYSVPNDNKTTKCKP